MRTLGQFTNAFIAPPTPQSDEWLPKDVVPFGKYGAGGWTGHPIGLVIALGIIVMALIGVPESRYFLAAALPLGAIFGFVLWKLHQTQPTALQGKRR
jgi:hypothetical protein